MNQNITAQDIINITDEQVAKAIDMQVEKMLLLIPAELITAKKIAMKVNAFLKNRSQGIEANELVTIEKDSSELPVIKKLIPDNYGELVDMMKWTYNRIVRNEINEELAKKFILLTDTFLIGEKIQKEWMQLQNAYGNSQNSSFGFKIGNKSVTLNPNRNELVVE